MQETDWIRSFLGGGHSKQEEKRRRRRSKLFGFFPPSDQNIIRSAGFLLLTLLHSLLLLCRLLCAPQLSNDAPFPSISTAESTVRLPASTAASCLLLIALFLFCFLDLPSPYTTTQPSNLGHFFLINFLPHHSSLNSSFSFSCSCVRTLCASDSGNHPPSSKQSRHPRTHIVKPLP